MPELKPLTATPPALPDFSRPCTPASTAFDDIYFSVDGGLEEARDVYLRGCGLPGHWVGREAFTIAELGFGTGLNFLATMEMWRERRLPPAARLTYIAVEGFPLSAPELRKAYAHWEDIPPVLKQLHEKWPDRVKGVHVLDFEDVRLILIHDPVEQALERIDFTADAWFLDGFTPSKNPDMWSQKVLKKVYALSAPGCRLGAFTVAGDVRRSLMNAGFEVSKQPGFGRKRERLEAVKPLEKSEVAAPPAPRVAIIGGGISGLMTAQHLQVLGAQPVIYIAEGHIAASGNQRAIIKPRLDLLDRPESRLFNAAYHYALQCYDGDHVVGRGVYQLSKSEKDRNRSQKLTQNAQLPQSHMTYVDAPECGLNASFGALYFPNAQVINPAEFCDDMLERFTIYKESIDKIVHGESAVELHSKSGIIAKFDHVVICAGQGVRDFLPDLDVRLQRGQITKVKSGSALSHAVTYGGYAIPDGDAIWLGATHGPHEGGDNAENIASDDQDNIDNFAARGGQAGAVLDHRASVRVTTPVTLPIAGSVTDHVHIISGLGGRGFVFAPLLGAHIAAKICGAPGVIAKDAAALFAPRINTP